MKQPTEAKISAVCPLCGATSTNPRLFHEPTEKALFAPIVAFAKLLIP